MKKRKGFADLWPMMLMWLLLSAMVWGWIFTFLTDTAPEKKISIFAYAPVPGAKEIALQLEQHMQGELEMVKVHPFTFAMMDGGQLETADLLILGASRAQEYQALFAALPDEISDAGELFSMGGVAYGVKIYDAALDRGPLRPHILYLDEETGRPEDFYLFFGANSLHTPGNPGAVDDQALHFARLLLEMGE